MFHHSRHAAHRAAGRAVREEDILFVITWGQPVVQRHGRVALHLGRREAREARLQGVHVPERAIGVAVVLADDGTVVTVLRSHDRHRLTTYGRHPRPRRPAGGGR